MDPKLVDLYVQAYVNDFMMWGLDSLRDTTYVTSTITKFLPKYVEGIQDTVRLDFPSGLHVYLAGANLVYKITQDSTLIQLEGEADQFNIPDNIVIRKRFYQDWLFWVIATILLGLFMKHHP